MDRELNYCEVINFSEAKHKHNLKHPRLEIDLERYRKYLDACDMSDDQKADFVNALWTVIVAFVGFGYKVQRKPEGGAQIIEFPSIDATSPNSSKQLGEKANA
ncbi:hypothetical protein [Thioclava kandeliae]|uniref:Uncharacterized protein n=1 Tax=Thioclava kandeliae TaxID=3070818 RepID=A0ABV1SLQ9_9RHOB